MRLVGLVSAAALLVAGGVGAQASNDVIKIGVLTDQNGIYSYVAGRGTVEAARLAVEDAGGKVLGKRIEILTDDDQNKPDIGGAIARKWIQSPCHPPLRQSGSYRA
jgi:branched-chain amino acid transport system substrate-binding protein